MSEPIIIEYCKECKQELSSISNYRECINSSCSEYDEETALNQKAWDFAVKTNPVPSVEELRSK